MKHVSELDKYIYNRYSDLTYNIVADTSYNVSIVLGEDCRKCELFIANVHVFDA